MSGVLAAPVLPIMNLVPVIPTSIDILNRHLGQGWGKGRWEPQGRGWEAEGEGECSPVDEEGRG